MSTAAQEPGQLLFCYALEDHIQCVIGDVPSLNGKPAEEVVRMAGCTDCASEHVSAEKLVDQCFRRILWIALLFNFAMFMVEFAASLWGDSMALQADALDFFGDAANYGISLFVLGMALRFRAYAVPVSGR